MGARQLTTAVTMFVLCALLVLGAVWGWKSLFAPLPGADGTAAPTPQCSSVDAGTRLRSAEVQVSVYNAGGRSGLAASTLQALEKRGFGPGEAGNAPADAKVRYAQVWSTKTNDAGARLVLKQLGSRARLRVVDTDLGPGVDVIVGRDFRGLVKAPRSVKVRTTQETCGTSLEPAG